jgi:hypothetical protein
MIKSSRMKCVGHVALKQDMVNQHKVLVGNLKEKHQLGDRRKNGRIILISMRKK